MKLSRVTGLGNLLIAALLMLAVWVLVIFVSARPALRSLIDLTPHQVNSVDEVTVELLDALRAEDIKVEFHLFFPGVAGRGQTVEQEQQLAIIRRLQELTRVLANRYRALGGEHVTVIEHDLRQNLDATREAAQAFGYEPPQSEVVVTVTRPGRERRWRKLSLTQDLALLDLPRQAQPGPRATVPVLKKFLGEEALSTAIKSLLVQGTPVVYLWGANSPDLNWSNASVGTGYGLLADGLAKLGFDVKMLPRQGVIPRDASVVFVPEPRMPFSDRDATTLFEFVRGGGRLFLNYNWSPQASWNPGAGKLGELLGYEIGQARIHHLIRDSSNRTGGRGLDGDPAVAKLELAIDPTHPVTRKLGARALEVANARPLEVLSSPDGVETTSILASGDKGWLARIQNGYPVLEAPQGVGLRQFLVGVAMTVAPAKTGGDDQAGDDEQVDGAGAGARAGSESDGRAVIVSGEFCNNLGMPLYSDLAFNIFNWLAEREVMLNLQTKQYQPRQMEVQPQQVARVFYLLFYTVPVVFLLGGIAVFFVRRRH